MLTAIKIKKKYLLYTWKKFHSLYGTKVEYLEGKSFILLENQLTNDSIRAFS